MKSNTEESVAGRTCPLDYKIEESSFDTIEGRYDTIYVIGGLYGNKFALKKIIEMANEEYNETNIMPKFVFNGDMHWFDYKYDDFIEIEKLSESGIKLLGNVEAEMIRLNDIGVGCGCSYPDTTSDDAVERSNEIHKKLKDLATKRKDVYKELEDRKKIVNIQVGSSKVSITHGDEKYLSGWDCSLENLSKKSRQEELYDFMKSKKIDVFATTHTCAQVVLKYEDKAVYNNGASGMASVNTSLGGIITRISTNRREDFIVEDKINDVYIQQCIVDYDVDEFISWFDEIWNIDSPASISYRNRIINGVECSAVKIESNK
ncbi:calcineurin phosphoesterase [Peptostreptococcus faecalis]|uniref:calcineurin phosphoesterase n=1 Tax=Peptostreptococcus faecalis TaxID=2045015 RepID=UPI000C7A507D|nr:calcineurin phosphoesterase [Peptostreptococcus faecalis]